MLIEVFSKATYPTTVPSQSSPFSIWRWISHWGGSAAICLCLDDTVHRSISPTWEPGLALTNCCVRCAAACSALIFVNLALIRHLLLLLPPLRPSAPQRLVNVTQQRPGPFTPRYSRVGWSKCHFRGSHSKNYNSLKMKYLITFEQPEPKHLEFGVYMLMRGFWVKH